MPAVSLLSSSFSLSEGSSPERVRFPFRMFGSRPGGGIGHRSTSRGSVMHSCVRLSHGLGAVECSAPDDEYM